MLKIFLFSLFACGGGGSDEIDLNTNLFRRTRLNMANHIQEASGVRTRALGDQQHILYFDLGCSLPQLKKLISPQVAENLRIAGFRMVECDGAALIP